VTVLEPNPTGAAVVPVLPGAQLPDATIGGEPPAEQEDLRGWGDWPTPPWLDAAGRWVAAIVGAFLVFGAILIANGADAAQVLSDAFSNTFTENNSLQQILIKATPFALAALAVVVPARAGLVNVGGEGQVLVGAIAAAGVGLWYDQHVKGDALLIVMFLAAAVAGAL
jgi:simple sugar transport system permease protein